MYRFNGNGRQFDDGSSFVRCANKKDCLRFKLIDVYKTPCNFYQYPHTFFRLISAVDTQSLCMSYTLATVFCSRESFCSLIESISNQKAADTYGLKFPSTYTQSHICPNIKYCTWPYIYIYRMTLLALFLSLHAFLKSAAIFTWRWWALSSVSNCPWIWRVILCLLDRASLW